MGWITEVLSEMPWRGITVRQYMDIKRINAYPNQSARERAALLMAVVFRRSPDYYESLSFAEFDKLLPAIAFCSTEPQGRVRKTIRIGFTTYRLQDIEDHNVDTGLSLIHFRNTGIYNNANKALAWMYKPDRKSYNPNKAADRFLNVPITHVIGAFFLFSRNLKKSKEAISVCKEVVMVNLTQHLEAVTKHFQGTGDGTIHSTYFSKPRQELREIR